MSVTVVRILLEFQSLQTNRSLGIRIFKIFLIYFYLGEEASIIYICLYHVKRGLVDKVVMYASVRVKLFDNLVVCLHVRCTRTHARKHARTHIHTHTHTHTHARTHARTH